jgi:hypothetical protein
LIPGFVGIGILIMNLLEGRFLQGIKDAIWPILVSLIMFGIFSSFLGGNNQFNQLWPLLLIGLGLWTMLEGVSRRRRREVDVIQEKPEE